MLSFDLSSAPKIFMTLADALEWCEAAQGIKYITHYLDDFAVIAPPDSEICARDLSTLKTVCKDPGVPLAAENKKALHPN